MLAGCLPGILPPLELAEALEVAQVRSLLGELPGRSPLDWARPFRAPHHGVSMAGLIGGGGGIALPGEISRAKHGVLFLDELAEFQTPVLQALRQPMESGRVMLTRSGGSVAYPARFTLAAATNPCPCGWAGDALRRCRCTPGAIDGYRRRLSGPLLDRIDLQVAVRRVSLENLASDPRGEASVAVWVDQHFGYLMCYTGDTLDDVARRRRSVAIEPMSCPPNAFRSGESLITLEPGQAWASSWGIRPT